MSQLVEVAFKGNRKEFFLWDGEEPPLHAAVITEADRGEDLGRVHAIGELATRRCTGCAHGCGTSAPTRRILRLATSDDERRAAELRAQDEDARRRARACVQTHGLVMKLTDAEWQWDRKKLTLYFTAEKRVDFRALVRDLASMFRTRIELKQIGVRDEAKRLDGVGRCGRQYCSASWLPELRPVNLQVAKDQRLSLNPSQISGACGRLMCCLRYEHEFYVQSRKRFPKEGRTLITALGEEKVVANDIFRDQVTLRNGEGDIRVVPLAELKRELEQRAAGERDVAERDDETASSDPDAEDSVLMDEAPTSARQGPAAGAERRERQRRPTARSENGDPGNGSGNGDGRGNGLGDGRSSERATSGSRGGRRRGRRGGRRNRPAGDAPKDPRSNE
ncbi:MAG TPA: regulatory iron-sulfur-containing complex subunit RicT [Gemmatimonadaceae bacterium]